MRSTLDPHKHPQLYGAHGLGQPSIIRIFILSYSLREWAYHVFVGNSVAKSVLCYLAHDCEISINKLSYYCEYSPLSIKKALNFLINNGFIEIREGFIPGYTSDKYDDIHQYKLLKDIKRN